jgi:hypothetical protein
MASWHKTGQQKGKRRNPSRVVKKVNTSPPSLPSTSSESTAPPSKKRKKPDFAQTTTNQQAAARVTEDDAMSESAIENNLNAGSSKNLNAGSSKMDQAKAITVLLNVQGTINVLRNISGLSEQPFFKKISPEKLKDGRFVDRTRVEPKTPNDKKIIIKKFIDAKVQFFAYTDESDKPSIYVLKGVDRADPPELQKQLIEIGLPVTNVSFLNSNINFPSYIVSFKRGEIDLQTLQFQYKIINYVKVDWQKFDRSKKRLTQCHRCQKFGHSASNCNLTPRCVKCDQNHEMGKDFCSRKTPTDPGTPKCVNCGGDHAANFKDCPERLRYAKKVQKIRNNRDAASRFASTGGKQSRREQNFNSNVENFPPLQTPHSSREAHQATWGQQQQQQQQQQNVNQSVSLTQNSNFSSQIHKENRGFSKIASLQARLDAIQGLAEVEIKFEAYVAALEACNGNHAQMFEVMLKFRTPSQPISRTQAQNE